MNKTILLPLILCFLLLGCHNTLYSAQHHQPLDQVTKIELLNSENDFDLIILYTLTESEIQPFLEKLMTFAFKSNGPPPETCYGPLAVRLYYENGYSDVIGIDANWYLDPEGNRLGGYYWYHLKDVDDYYTLFSQYVDTDLLPRPDHARYK